MSKKTETKPAAKDQAKDTTAPETDQAKIDPKAKVDKPSADKPAKAAAEKKVATPPAEGKDKPKPVSTSQPRPASKTDLKDFKCLPEGTVIIHYEQQDDDWFEGVITGATRSKGGRLEYQIAYPKNPHWEPISVRSDWVLQAPIIE